MDRRRAQARLPQLEHYPNFVPVPADDQSSEDLNADVELQEPLEEGEQAIELPVNSSQSVADPEEESKE